MQITLELLESLDACSDGIEYVTKHNMLGLDHGEFVKRLKTLKRIQYATWLMPRLLKTKVHKVEFSIYCAELVLHIFEDQHPNDNRPRLAIEAAKKWMLEPTEENANAANVAYYAAYAAYAANSAYYAVSAIYAANAVYAANTVHAANAVYAAYAAYASAHSEKKALSKIIKYWLKQMELE